MLCTFVWVCVFTCEYESAVIQVDLIQVSSFFPLCIYAYFKLLFFFFLPANVHRCRFISYRRCFTHGTYAYTIIISAQLTTHVCHPAHTHHA